MSDIITVNDLNLWYGPTQALHHAADQCLGQILHAFHTLAHGSGGQLFAQHGDGVELVAGT